MSNKFFSAILICLSSFYADKIYAQGWMWAKGATALSQYATSSTTDAEGNLYVSGSFYGNTLTLGTSTLTNTGFPFAIVPNMFLAKYSPDGNIIWAKNSSYPAGNSMITDASGNVYTIGTFVGNITAGSLSFTNPGGLTLMIVKYDSIGNVIWVRCEEGAYGASETSPNSIAIDAIGNLYIAGSFRDTIKFDGGIVLNNNGIGCHLVTKLFLAKLDAAGNTIWAKTTNDGNYDRALAVAVDAANNIYITGDFPSYTVTFGTTVLSNDIVGGIGYDMFLVKYDPAGNVIWAKNNGGRVQDAGSALCIDHANNIYVTGDFYDSVTFGTTILSNPYPGTADIFLSKYDTSGNVIWAKSAGGANDDGSESVATDNSGSIYVSGGFSSTSATFGTNEIVNDTIGTSNIFIAKYNASGENVWATGTGDVSNESAKSIACDLLGNVYCVGNFYSPTISFGASTLLTNDLTLTNSNMFVAKLHDIGANHPPSFTGGHFQTTHVCVDGSIPINTLLNAVDVDAGQTETWSLIMPPIHGSVVGAFSETSTGGTLNPAGFIYTPAPGYSGTDYFKVKISDGSLSFTTTIFVSVDPYAGAISGLGSLCVGDTITFTNNAVGGLWVSGSPSIATIDSLSGYLTCISPGADLLSYSVNTTCGIASVYMSIVVNEQPYSGIISGAQNICNGTVVNLTDSVTAGNWWCSNTNASVTSSSVSGDGIVTALAAGIDTIFYTVSNSYSCSSNASYIITISDSLPSAGVISGETNVCPYNTATLTNTVASGSWTISNPSIATVTTDGILTGITPGTAIVTYTVSNGCGSNFSTQTINVLACASTKVNTPKSDSQDLDIYPNPNLGNFTVSLSSSCQEQVEIVATNELGKIVEEYKTATNFVNHMSLHTSPGVYFISATTSHGIYRTKFTIQ